MLPRLPVVTTPPSLHPDLPRAVRLPEFLDVAAATVAPLGFTAANTLAAVSICRDELTQHLMADVEQRWGPPFGLGGLGGVPVLGRTGWGACLSHVPEDAGRGKLLVFGLPHLGLGPRGSVGESLRRGQVAPTPTCGALNSILATWGGQAATIDGEAALADQEADLLRRLVAAELDGPPADIVEITRAAAAAVVKEMNAQLEALAPWDRMDVALFAGMQVHLPDDVDHVVPITAEYWSAGGACQTLERLAPDPASSRTGTAGAPFRCTSSASSGEGGQGARRSTTQAPPSGGRRNRIRSCSRLGRPCQNSTIVGVTA